MARAAAAAAEIMPRAAAAAEIMPRAAAAAAEIMPRAAAAAAEAVGPGELGRGYRTSVHASSAGRIRWESC